MAIRPTAVLDANVLVQAPVRDTLLCLAEGPDLYRPLWSAEIMAEVRRTLGGPFGIAPNRIAHLESKLREHFPEACIEGFEPLIAKMTNDAKDRHVLAAAAHAKAHLLVTYNLKHFPLSSTQPWRVNAVGPSLLLKKLYASDPESVIEVLREQATDIQRTFVAQLRVLRKAVPAFVEVVCHDTRTVL
ncbi:PIN domain-containing protein [uncultured Paludibaculum sp.]|uniref:PIN domain-containing protein n=1 Tax=uncultured Paludibaculum sp. TaxID=1765020 RepID=UPI002AAA7C52|nr:PIN domain-containing protein [uncultured Paludibaculum sp.]